jgi:hypothetical protein
MLLSRSANVHILILWGIVFICFCVMMYALGSPMTLWSLELQLDPVNAPLLEGFSLPSHVVDLQPTMSGSVLSEPVPDLRHLLDEHVLLRPPNSLA